MKTLGKASQIVAVSLCFSAATFAQSPLVRPFTTVRQDLTGPVADTIAIASIAFAFIGHRMSDSDHILHRMWPLLMGVGFLSGAVGAYNYLFK